ncbi:MmcQ/YjbR family DNA-binding protein [Candidatus Saccharibacteria bacterium]|nr:MmcQ/YjbR family DNA-binding protein [Candidatus Saccharibacteria bacterium]
MTRQEIDKFLMNLPGVWLDYPFEEGVAVYRFGEPDGKMIAIVQDNSKPLKVSLRCDPLLAKNLRQKFETVLPGENLDKKRWNTVLCSGQLSKDEVFDLARHSYQLALDG